MSSNARTSLRLVWPYLRRRMGALGLLLAVGAVSAFAQRAIVLFIFPAIDVLFPREARGPITVDSDASGIQRWLAAQSQHVYDWIVGEALREPLANDARMDALVRIGILTAALAVFTGVATYTFSTLSRWIVVRMVVALRVDAARHLMGLSMSYHGRRHFGDLLSRFSTDVNTTMTAWTQCSRDLVQEPLLALSSLVIAWYMAPIPTIVVAAGMVVIGFHVWRQGRRVKKSSSKSLSQLGTSVQALSQMFNGIRTVKAFRAEEREIENYRQINDSYLRTTMKMTRAQALSNAGTMVLSHGGMGVMMIVVGWLIIVKHEMSGDPKAVTAFFLSIAGIYGSVKDIARAITTAQESAGAAERIQQILDERADVVERPGAHALPGLGSGIRFEAVDFAYAEGHGNALAGVSLEVRPGETLALVGPSGSGKSTLVDLVARFIDPTQGRITVDGHDLRDLTLDAWTSQFALVGQTPFLFHTTIEENIRYGKPSATHAQVEESARMAGIHEFIAALPAGYATNVADAGARLSGGQRQRITIARAFLKGAPLLLLDEATSALDTESEQVVQESLERLMQDRTVIVIAHRLSTIRNAHRIAVLEDSRLVEIGTHHELLARGGTYARLHAAQYADTAAT